MKITLRRVLPLVLLGVCLLVPRAQAQSFIPTFSCTSCGYIPTSTPVTFASPSIFESWDTSEGNVENFITMAPGDNPGDMYTWSNTLAPDIVPELADYTLFITDVTTGDTEGASGTIGVGDILFESSISDSGTLTFAPNGSTPAPEPGTIGLLLVGIGGLLAARKLCA